MPPTIPPRLFLPTQKAGIEEQYNDSPDETPPIQNNMNPPQRPNETSEKPHKFDHGWVCCECRYCFIGHRPPGSCCPRCYHPTFPSGGEKCAECSDMVYSKATGISSTPFRICISQWRLVGTVHVTNAIGITRMTMCFQSAVVGAAMLVRCLDLVAGSRWNDGREAKDYSDARTSVNLCTYTSRCCRAKFTQVRKLITASSREL
jgi:hypothetical protein